MASRFKRRATITMVIISISTLLPLVAPAPAQAATTTTIASSGDPNVQARWFSLRGYGTIRSQVNWPKRTEGCAPFGAVTDKILPWQAELPGLPVYKGSILNGDDMDLSTDCSDRYHDAGTSTFGGAWIDPNAQGSWSAAGVQAANWGPAYQSPSSVVVPKCNSLVGGAAPPIWGDIRGGINPDGSDQFYTSGPVGSYGATPLPGVAPGIYKQNFPAGVPDASGLNLYSNGVSLLRQNFTLTAADLANLSLPGAKLLITGVADDFLAVYINGVMTQAITTSSVAVTTLDLTPSIGLLNLTVGATNTLAIMDADKSIFYPGSDPLGRQVGACYNLNISFTVPPPPVIDKPGFLAQNGDIHAGGGVGACGPPPAGNGQVVGNVGASSQVEYVISASDLITDVASNAGNNKLTLGAAGQYGFICRPDLLNAAQALNNSGSGFTPIPSGKVNLNTLGSGVFIVRNGPATIDCGGSCTINNRTTLVVLSGDLTIKSPIKIINGSRPKAAIPSLGVIASGDINIVGSVKRIDAFLFSSAGTIDTCVEATVVACGGAPLVVSGFLMSQHMLLHRTGDSTINGPTLGEEVILNPILYLSPPALFDAASIDDIVLEGQGERSPLF
jgi:hypothetical protein